MDVIFRTSIHLILILGTLYGCSQPAHRLTEQQVTDTVTALDDALRSANGGVLQRLYAPNIRVTFVDSRYGQKVLTGPQFINKMRDVALRGYDYTARRDHTEITLSPDGRRALHRSMLAESIVLDGHRIENHAEELMTIEWVDGRALITAIHASH